MARRKGSGIISLRFNQDQGCFTCCMDTGLRIYNVDPLVEKAHYTTEEVGDVVLCEMLYRTNLLLMVRGSNRRKLLVFDDAKLKFAAEVTFALPIKAVRVRKERLVVVVEGGIHVLSWPRLSRLTLVRTPPASPHVAIATSPTASHTLLAAPAHRAGAVQILDLANVRTGASATPAQLQCHGASIASLALSTCGAYLVTASTRGTVLRVFDAPRTKLLHELRRGAENAALYCMSVSNCGGYVSCASDRGTLHVWCISEPGRNRRAAGALAAAARVLPASAAAYAASQWAHATARAPPDTPAHVTLLTHNTFAAICEDGTYQKFVFSAEGSCHAESCENFLNVGDDDDFME